MIDAALAALAARLRLAAALVLSVGLCAAALVYVGASRLCTRAEGSGARE